MPMIVDPSAPLIEPPERVTSPDGYVTAIIDGAWAGVILAVDYQLLTTPIVNWIINPSMETTVTGTAAYDPGAVGVSRSRTSGAGKYGAYRQVVTPNTASTVTSGISYTLGRPMVAGETVTLSAWTRTPYTATMQVRLRSSGSGAERTVTVPQPAVSSEWAPLQATLTVGAGESFDRAVVSLTGAGGAWAIDGVMLQTGTEATGYVDGDQPECVWDGAPHASISRRVRNAAAASGVRRVRIVRQDPGAAAPVPVRSADPAWALDGVGTAYDHEAPLGVAVVYTATPIYADGSTGSSSALAVTVPAPPQGPRDVWIKSLDEPGLSAQVTVTSWPELSWAARIDSAAVQGSAYPVTSQDVYTAAASAITIDAEGDQIEALQQLLITPGVRLVQTRPDYHRPDQYVLLSDVQQVMDSTPTESRSYQAALSQVGRPITTDQPMRMPDWSYDELARRFATSDAAVASYSTWASLSTDGAA